MGSKNFIWYNSKRLTIFIFAIMMMHVGCQSSKRTKAAIIGAAAGALAGAVISKKNLAVGAILGAAIGGVAGGIIGEYMDRQAEEIRRDLKGAKVERVGEGILVTFDSGLLFDFDSYQLRLETKKNLGKLAKTLNKYDDTKINVLGHTDNVGKIDYNEKLSLERAVSVDNYLKEKEVSGLRLVPVGFGEEDPVTSNDTKEGRQLNRRVEVTIVASKKLIRDARRGKIPNA